MLDAIRVKKSLFSSSAIAISSNQLMQDRVRKLNDNPVEPMADHVLYFVQANRRFSYNHALAHAIELANQLNLPVLVFEGLIVHEWATDRLHTFMLQGVPDLREELQAAGIGYCFYYQSDPQENPVPMVQELVSRAACVVTDDYPTYIPARNNSTWMPQLPVAVFAVDSSCVVPMSRYEKREYAAYTIRPKIHRMLPEYLQPFKMPEVQVRFEGKLPSWNRVIETNQIADLVAKTPVDHSVRVSTAFEGGEKAARVRFKEFLKTRLQRYAGDRNEPSRHATSNMSPYLHFGHISSLDLALQAAKAGPADEYLEELIVRRELAFNFARWAPQVDSLDVLPDWVHKTLNKHDDDPRDPLYNRQQMEQANTHDDLWNATQKELLLRGKIHGYYRMYWGKKIIEWSESHREAHSFLLYLHDRYALDGRDPNTYTNVLWLFGLHDRPWTERPIFGQIRYMNYAGMKRKTNIAAYIKEIDYLERTGKEAIPV
jgi:deoxyribodipyrimidine photo-lyase